MTYLFVSCSAFGQISRDSLFVFTGKIISIKKEKFVDIESYFEAITVNDSIVYIEIPKVVRDHNYKAKFKIINQYEGNLSEKEIKFDLYYHHGKPKFKKSNIYLLFVIKINGEYQLLRYAHRQVFETSTGQYAIPYDTNEYRNQKTPLTDIDPERIHFKKVPKFRLYKNDAEEWIQRTFPEPYYRFEKMNAIPQYGNYITDYIKLRLNGTLKEVFEE